MSKKHRRPLHGPSNDPLKQAIAHHQAGRLTEAEGIYRGLAVNSADATQLLGVVCFQTNRQEEGLHLMERSLELDPHHVEALCNLAVAHHELGDHEKGLLFIDRALAERSSRADLLDRRGFILQDLGRHQEAIQSLQLAVELEPEFADAWLHLGNSHLAVNDLEQAEAAFRQTLKLRPHDQDALTNLGSVLVLKMEPSAAIPLLERSIGILPTAEAYFNLSSALAAIGNPEGSIRNGRLAAQLQPKSAKFQENLGQILNAHRLTDEAIVAFRKALELEPDSTSARVLLANALNQKGQYQSGQDVLSGAGDPSATVRLVKALLFPVIPQSRQEIEELRAGSLKSIRDLASDGPTIKEPWKSVGLTTFNWSYHSETERPLQEALVSLYKTASPDLLWESPYLGERPSGKLRIGVYCSLLQRHTIGKLFRRVIAALPDEDIEVVVFNGGTTVDDWTQELNFKVDRSYRVTGDMKAVRQLIAGKRLDALFYPEIGMNAFTYYLAYARLAPLQFMTWGHPVSTALPNMDVFLSSEGLEQPGSESEYTERLVKLPSLMTDFERPSFRPISRADLGLPENMHIYACPQTLFKLHPDMDEVFAEILRRDEKGIIVLLTGSDAYWDQFVMERFKRSMSGVSDRVQILRRLNQDEYIGLCACADVVLDTFYFGGGNSSLEAFSVGVIKDSPTQEETP